MATEIPKGLNSGVLHDLNPIGNDGQVVTEADTGLTKVCDGATHWQDLPYQPKSEPTVIGTAAQPLPGGYVPPVGQLVVTEDGLIIGDGTTDVGDAEPLSSGGGGGATLAGNNEFTGDNRFSQGTVTLGEEGTHTVLAAEPAAENITLTLPSATGTLARTEDLSIYATTTAVNNLVRGLGWKKPCRVATVGNIDLSDECEDGDVIDGVTLEFNDRVLVKNQTTGSENGIYLVQASGPPSRAPDVFNGFEIVGTVVMVLAGDVNADTMWAVTNNQITTGVTAIVFSRFAATALVITNADQLLLADPSDITGFSFWIGPNERWLVEVRFNLGIDAGTSIGWVPQFSVPAGASMVPHQTTIESPGDSVTSLLNGVGGWNAVIPTVATGLFVTLTATILTGATGGMVQFQMNPDAAVDGDYAFRSGAAFRAQKM